jgi:hypothetical protein
MALMAAARTSHFSSFAASASALALWGSGSLASRRAAAARTGDTLSWWKDWNAL